VRTDSLDEEIELSIDLFLTSTNIDFLKYYEGDLWDLECVRNMMKLVHMLDEYLEHEYLKDKLSAVKMIYSGSI
jgi:hypothetical protein